MPRRVLPKDGSPTKMNQTSNNRASCSISGSWGLNSVDSMTCANNKCSMARHYMLIPWTVRSCVMLFLVCFLSLLQGADEIQHVDALTSKDSILNQVFVKMGWAWSLCSAATLTLSLLPISSQRAAMAGRAAARLILLTGVFYFWCALIFPSIEHWTGLCLSKNVVVSRHHKRKCLKSGHQFYSFDISGHAFLMVYCTLTLVQEAHAMRRYISMGKAIANLAADGGFLCPTDSCVDHVDGAGGSSSIDTKADFDASSTDCSAEDKLVTDNNHNDSGSDECVSPREAAKYRAIYMLTWPLVCLCYACLCLLCLTWDVVLLITTVYYHTLLEKFLGVVIAVTSWATLYEFIFVKLKVV